MKFMNDIMIRIEQKTGLFFIYAHLEMALRYNFSELEWRYQIGNIYTYFVLQIPNNL